MIKLPLDRYLESKIACTIKNNSLKIHGQRTAVPVVSKSFSVL